MWVILKLKSNKEKAIFRSPDKFNIYFVAVRQHFGQGKTLFGQGKILFGQGKTLFGQGKILFEQGKILFGQGKTLFGQGKILFGQGKIVFGQGSGCGVNNWMTIVWLLNDYCMTMNLKLF